MASPHPPTLAISSPASSSVILTLSPQFLSDRAQIVQCAACKEHRAIRIDGCHLCVCLKCDHRFCSVCHLPWVAHGTTPTAISTASPAPASVAPEAVVNVGSRLLDGTRL